MDSLSLASGYGVVIGGRYHFEGVKSTKNLAVMPNGNVHAHGGKGDHATFTCEAGSNQGSFKFKNESGGYLAIGGDGQLKRGEGGKWCEMQTIPTDGNICIRSVHSDCGVGFDEAGEIKPPAGVKHGKMAQFIVHSLSSVVVGGKYHFEGGKSGKNLAVMPNGNVHAHGGKGNHATWTVHGNRGHYQFKNDSDSFLACGGGGTPGEIRAGKGGKFCDFFVIEHEGHVLIRSAHDGWDFGVGFDEDGQGKPPAAVQRGRMAQFKVIRL